MTKPMTPRDYLEPDFAQPYNTWRTDPTPDNADVFLKAVDPVISAALRTYAGGQAQSPTLRSKAKLLTLDAAGRYDPTQAKLRTHLMFQLQGLRRQAARETQILSLPEQVALDLGHVRSAENELRDKLGRDPSEAEVADWTGLSRKRLTYIRRARPAVSESAFQQTSEEGEDFYSPTIVERNNVAQWHEFVYHDLSPVDQLIMEHTLGMHGKRVLSNKDLAKKLRVSPGAVSQRKAKIQSKLDLRDEYSVI